MHRPGRGFVDYRVEYWRKGADLLDPIRSRQKQTGRWPDPEHKPEKWVLHKANKADLKQIFIRSTAGRHVCVQIWDRMSVLELKKEIQDKLEIPVALQILIFSGHCMQDQHSLQHYRVAKDSTIALNHRLRGGYKGATSKTTGTYRDAAKGKELPKGKEPTTVNAPPGQYIVDQAPENPSISLDLPEVNYIFSDLQKTLLFVDLTVSGLRPMLCTNGFTRPGQKLSNSPMFQGFLHSNLPRRRRKGKNPQ